jgi:hypothetical protein
VFPSMDSELRGREGTSASVRCQPTLPAKTPSQDSGPFHSFTFAIFHQPSVVQRPDSARASLR